MVVKVHGWRRRGGSFPFSTRQHQASGGPRRGEVLLLVRSVRAFSTEAGILANLVYLVKLVKFGIVLLTFFLEIG